MQRSGLTHRGDPARVAAAGGPLPPVDLPLACRGCGRHFRMHADAWIALLAGAGTWQECWADVRPTDHLGWMEPRPYREIIEAGEAAGLNESVRTGPCTIGPRHVWLAAFDFRFMGGSLGAVGGERLARGMEQAARLGWPYLLVAASGGARMQEGALALLQMAKVNAALGRLRAAGCPYVTILTDPTFGGVAASLALLGDVNIAEPGASIGFTGARVIEQATHTVLADGFQSAEFQLAHGQVDLVVPRPELRTTIARLLEFLA